MKPIIIIIFLNSIWFSCKAQSAETLTQLIDLTIYNEVVANTRELYSEELNVDKDFKGKFDSITDAYYNRFNAFYTAQYSADELKRLLEFYSTSTGRRHASDVAKLYQEEFPETDPLYDRLVLLKKNVKFGIPTFELEGGGALFVESAIVDFVIRESGVEEFMKELKEIEIMNIQPKYEACLVEAYDIFAPRYIKDVKRYYITNYSKDELDQLYNFYNSPLGKKVSGNAYNFMKLSLNAESEWSENLTELILTR